MTAADSTRADSQARPPVPGRPAATKRGGRIVDAVLVALALVTKLATPSPDWIEAHYSNGFYPAVDRTVRAVTGPLPFCLGDVLFVVTLAWLVRFWIVSLRARRPLVALSRTVAAAAVIVVWFLISWGYGYWRVPLADKIPVHDERTNEDTVDAFADRVTDLLTRYADAAHAQTLDDAEVARRLVPRFEATIARLGDRSAFAPPRIKPTFFQPLLQASATTGFTDPWTHEVNIDASLFAFERPAIYAHEWAHISGFNDEAEANFISVIACTTSPDPLLKYSGWLLVWENLPQDVHLTHKMGKTAYDDLMAIRARYVRNVNPQVEKASRTVYNQYLKANHVKAGYASYHLFIRWMTGADFDAGGLPIVAPGVEAK